MTRKKIFKDATIPSEFMIVASKEKFNGSVWAVYAYITTRMDLESGTSMTIKDSEICEALSISKATLDRAKATLKKHDFIEEQNTEGTYV